MDFCVKLEWEPVLFTKEAVFKNTRILIRETSKSHRMACSVKGRPRVQCNNQLVCIESVSSCTAHGASLAFLRPVSQRSITMLRVLSAALAVSTVAALQPPLASKAAAAKANPAAVDLYSRATATSAARDVALYGMFGPSEAEKRAEQARIDAEQEALNEKFRKESESDFAFMSVFGVVTCVRGVLGMCLRETSGTHV